MSAKNPVPSPAQAVMQRLTTALESCDAQILSSQILSEVDDLATKLIALADCAKEERAGEEDKDPAHGLGDAVLLTTNAGLELEVRKEVVNVCGECNAVVASPFGCPGYVLVSGAPMDKLLTLRSVHEVMNYEGHFVVPESGDGPKAGNGGDQDSKEGAGGAVICEDLKYICQQMKAFHLKGMENVKSFRVTCTTSGFQSFKSNEAEREVGSVVHEKYQIRADMKNFEVAVRIGVCLSHVLVSTSPNRGLLSKRHKLAFTRTVTLKPNVAFCMIQMCNPKQEGFSLIDPFCGGGTVLLEAAEMFGDKIGTLFGCDRSDAAVKGSAANAQAAGGAALSIRFEQLNAQAVDRKFAPETFDACVTNPPWGIRISADQDLAKIYRGFLYAVSKVVKKGGRVIMMVSRCELVLETIRRTGLYNILRVCAVKTGEQIPSIFVLENRGDDVLRQDLKAQIRTIAPLVAFKSKDAEKDSQFEDAASDMAKVGADMEVADDAVQNETARQSQEGKVALSKGGGGCKKKISNS